MPPDALGRQSFDAFGNVLAQMDVCVCSTLTQLIPLKIEVRPTADRPKAFSNPYILICF